MLSHILKDNVQCKEQVRASFLFTSLFFVYLTVRCLMKDEDKMIPCNEYSFIFALNFAF